MVRLPGLTVVVGEDCVGCGSCLSACPVQVISMDGGLARIGAGCKGCGRCVAVCPEGVVELQIDRGDRVLEKLVARIEQRTDIS